MPKRNPDIETNAQGETIVSRKTTFASWDKFSREGEVPPGATKREEKVFQGRTILRNPPRKNNPIMPWGARTSKAHPGEGAGLTGRKLGGNTAAGRGDSSRNPGHSAVGGRLGPAIPSDLSKEIGRWPYFRYRKEDAVWIRDALKPLIGKWVAVTGGGGGAGSPPAAYGILTKVTLTRPITKGQADKIREERPNFDPRALEREQTHWGVKASIKVTRSNVGFITVGEVWTPTLASWQVHEVLGESNPGRKKGGGRGLSVPERHQLTIARRTLEMPDAMVGVMGGPNKAQAREIIKRLTGRAPKDNPAQKLYGVFWGTKWGLTTSRKVAVERAIKEKGHVYWVPYHRGDSWDAPTFRAVGTSMGYFG